MQTGDTADAAACRQPGAREADRLGESDVGLARLSLGAQHRRRLRSPAGAAHLPAGHRPFFGIDHGLMAHLHGVAIDQ